MDKEYESELEKVKFNFYRSKIKRLRTTNPKQWYRELKNLTSLDQQNDDEIIVDSIKEYSNKDQAEMIAEKFAEVSQEYDKLEKSYVKVPEFSESISANIS